LGEAIAPFMTRSLGMTLGYPRNVMVLGLKDQRSRSQGQKVQKHIEGDRVAGVSLHSVECQRL